MSRRLCAILTLTALTSLAGCSAFSSQADLCDSKVSVADFLTTIQSGVGGMPESQYAQMRMTAFDVYDATVAAMENVETQPFARSLQPLLQKFVQEMDALSWDFSLVADSEDAITALSGLSTDAALQYANQVDAFMIKRCGTASTVAVIGEGEVTLPGPVISQPSDSLPVTNSPNDNSEASALGYTVATAFGLTLNESQLLCLGTALTGVYDASGSSRNIDQYTQQFQTAFNNCNIDVVID